MIDPTNDPAEQEWWAKMEEKYDPAFARDCPTCGQKFTPGEHRDTYVVEMCEARITERRKTEAEIAADIRQLAPDLQGQAIQKALFAVAARIESGSYRPTPTSRDRSDSAEATSSPDTRLAKA